MTEMFKTTADKFYGIVNAGFATAEARKSLKGLAIAMLDMIDDGFDGLNEIEADRLTKTAAELCESFVDWHDVDGISTFALLKRTDQQRITKELNVNVLNSTLFGQTLIADRVFLFFIFLRCLAHQKLTELGTTQRRINVVA